MIPDGKEMTTLMIAAEGEVTRHLSGFSPEDCRKVTESALRMWAFLRLVRDAGEQALRFAADTPETYVHRESVNAVRKMTDVLARVLEDAGVTHLLQVQAQVHVADPLFRVHPTENCKCCKDCQSFTAPYMDCDTDRTVIRREDPICKHFIPRGAPMGQSDSGDERYCKNCRAYDAGMADKQGRKGCCMAFAQAEYKAPNTAACDCFKSRKEEK